MMGLDALLGYAALGYCVWQAASTTFSKAGRGGHALPAPPKSVNARPSQVDGALRPFFVTSHGLALYIRKWLPRFDCPPRGVVFLVHGLGEHGGRYSYLAREMAKNGLAVFSVDHQGHGMSDGERQYAGKLAHLTEDYMEFVRHVLNGPAPGTMNANIIDAELEAHADVDWAALPRFVFGHSMGGTVTLQLVELSQEQNLPWDGVVLSSPALWAFAEGGCPAPVRMLGKLLPRFTLPGMDFSQLGDDIDVFDRWARDPLRDSHGTTLQLGVSVALEGWRFTRPDAQLAKTFPAPLYMLHGELDTLTFPQGSVAFYTACTQEDKTLNIIPDSIHEVLGRAGHQQVTKELLGWMQARLK